MFHLPKLSLHSSLLIYFVTRSTSSVLSGANTLAALCATPGNDASQRKQPFEESPNSGVESISAASSLSHRDKKRWMAANTAPPRMSQLTLLGTKHDPAASDWMDIAVADFIFSNALPISLVKCAKFQQLLKCARFIPPSYSLPTRRKMTRNLLDGLYQSAYIKQIESLLKQSKVFGISVFGMVLLSRSSRSWISWRLVQIIHLHCCI